AFGALIGIEAKPVKRANVLSFYEHIAGGCNLCFEHRVFFQSTYQDACATVDKSPNQALMQSVRKSILYRSRALLPMARVGKPLRAVGGKSPCTNMGDTIGERIDVAIRSIGIGNLPRKPIVGKRA